MKIIITLLLLCSLSLVQANPQKYYFTFDYHFSAHSGDSYTRSFMKAYHQLTGVPHQETAIRLLQFALDTIIITPHVSIFQHEVWGHGARLREFGRWNNGYAFGFYQGTTFSMLKGLNRPKVISVITGGLEGNNISARNSRRDWFLQQHVDYSEAILYLQNATSQLSYIQSSNYYRRGHDINAYIRTINLYHGSNVINRNQLHKLAWIDLVDPFLLYAMIASFKYISHQHTQWQLPFLQIGSSIRYLPALKLLLAPYGLEVTLHNFVYYQSFPILCNLRFGNTGQRSSIAVDIDLPHVYRHHPFTISLKSSLWIQPKLTDTNIYQGHQQFGILVATKGQFDITEKFSTFAELGVKSSGFVPGEILKGSGYARLGLLLQI